MPQLDLEALKPLLQSTEILVDRNKGLKSSDDPNFVSTPTYKRIALNIQAIPILGDSVCIVIPYKYKNWIHYGVAPIKLAGRKLAAENYYLVDNSLFCHMYLSIQEGNRYITDGHRLVYGRLIELYTSDVKDFVTILETCTESRYPKNKEWFQCL